MFVATATTCPSLRAATPVIRYDAESPDEAALVSAAQQYNYAMTARSSQTFHPALHPQASPARSVTVHVGERKLRFHVLSILHFDSARKRMSGAATAQ